MVLGICDTPKVLEVMNIVNIIITIIRIVVPIVLLFSLTFKLVNASTKNDEDALASIKKKAVPSIIAAALIFIVPVLVNLIVSVSFPNSEYTKCIANISNNTIQDIYTDKEEKLVSKAEETLNINDYINAKNYLTNIKDDSKRESYEARLEEVKKLIDEARAVTADGYVDKDYGTGKWVYHNLGSEELKKYTSSPMAFAEYVPEYAVSSGDSLPLIIFLHGLGHTMYQNDNVTCLSSSCLLNSIHVKTIERWGETGLKNIPAIMMAPHLEYQDWSNSISMATIKAIIEYSRDKYNVDTNKVVLMGHSHGSYGVPKVYTKAPDLFSALIMTSGSNPEATKEQKAALQTIPLKGFSEDNGNHRRMIGFFESIGRIDDLTIYKGERHDGTPARALTTDEDGDGISDLIYWALSQSK